MLLSNQTLGRFVRSAVLGGTLFLTACGFAPVYGPQGTATALQNQITFAEPADRNDFDFVAQIERRLGSADQNAFVLDYVIETTSDALAITSAQEINRYNVTGAVRYTLRDTNGQIINQGRVNSFTSYSAADTTVSTLTGERDAQTRLMVILADKVVTRLLASASPAR